MPETKKHSPTIEALLTTRIATLEKRIDVLEEALARQASAPQTPAGTDASVQRDTPKVPAMAEGGNDDEGERFEIVSVDSRTFEVNQDEETCKFSWKIVVKNLTEETITLSAQVEFVDMDSYLVEEDSATGFRLDPGETGKFRGFKWISTEAENQIMGARAHLAEVGVEPDDEEPLD